VSVLNRIKERHRTRRPIDADDMRALAHLAIVLGMALSDGTISDDELNEMQAAVEELRRARGK